MKQADSAACCREGLCSTTEVKDSIPTKKSFPFGTKKKGYILKAMPRLFFPFTGAYYLTFPVIFRFCILLMRQKIRVRIMHDWKVGLKAVIHNWIYSHHGQWHLHTKCVVMIFVPHYLPHQLFICSALSVFYILKTHANQLPHNAIQTLYRLKNSVCYNILFLFSFPYLSLILFFCFEVPGIKFLTEFHQNKDEDKKLVCICIYIASSSVVWNVKITGTILINTICLLCTIRALIKYKTKEKKNNKKQNSWLL